MGQKKRKKACKTPPSTPKDASETPNNNESRRYGGPFWAPLSAHKGPQRGPQDTLGAPRGPPKQRQTKTQSPLTKNAEDKTRTTKTHPKSDRHLRGFCAPALRGVFGEMPRHEENTQTCVLLVFWTPGGAKTQEHLIFYKGF